MLTKPTSQAMKEVPRWLVWKYGEPDARGKRPKVPHNARTGFRCDPTNPDSWTTHDEAAAMAGFDGLGFALGDGWQGIDFDAVDANGLSDLVNAATGYVEYSPSGAGAHAIGFGQPFPTLASNASGLEAYSGGRYFTFTGRGFRDDPLTDLAPFVVQAVAARHGAGKAAPAAPPAREQVGPLDAATMAQLADALARIDADSREDWISVIAALRSIPDNGGFELARDWSRGSSKHDDADFAEKWGENWKHSHYRAVFSMAQAKGWKNPGWQQDVTHVNNPIAANNPFAGQGEPEFLDTMDLSEILRLVKTTPPRQFTTTFYTPIGEVTLLSADGGVGKTMFTLMWSMCLTYGISALSLEVPSPVPVLFATAEDPAVECGWRLQAIANEMHLTLAGEWATEGGKRFNLWDMQGQPLWVETRDNPAGTATPALIELERRIIATGAKQVFIDNVSTVFMANHNDMVPVFAFIGALRRIAARNDCNILLLAHVNAETATKGGAKTFNGSVAWHNGVRSRMYMKPVPADGDMPEHIVVSHEKTNVGRIGPSFRLRKNSETGVLSAFSNHDVAIAIDESFAPLVEQVFRHIQAGQDEGQHVRCATTGSRNFYHCLSALFPKDYPENDKGERNRVRNAIAKLAEEKRIVRRNEWASDGKNKYERWVALAPDDPLFGKGV
jgi:hypothetical protein